MFIILFKGKELCHIYIYIFLFIYLVSYPSRYNYDMFSIQATNKYNKEKNKYINKYLFIFIFFFIFILCFQAYVMANWNVWSVYSLSSSQLYEVWAAHFCLGTLSSHILKTLPAVWPAVCWRLSVTRSPQWEPGSACVPQLPTLIPWHWSHW